MINKKYNGLISDIQRFSLHDGPGIRTTVFLKGCPLNCKWCHNPETREYKPQISFSVEKCKNCFKCVDVCPSGAHIIYNNSHKLNFSKCNLSGNCVDVCPNDALKIIGNENSVDDLMEIVLRDKNYYKNSGGGLTLSGGEPMYQFTFSKNLLKAAKLNGIHTAMETCGYASKKRFLEITNLVDLFLFDYKETDPKRHIDFTGVDNKLILENLEALHNNGANIILRCPIIPGINDRNDHFESIAQISRSLPNIKGIELMAYHDIGRDKAIDIGMDNHITDIENATYQTKKDWISKLNTFQCTNVSIG